MIADGRRRMTEHEHEFVPWCGACGRPMDRTGQPPVCHGCGDCYDAPKECEICGLEEKDVLS